MNVRSLRYFLAVAEELHFGRAAAKLHISQPPLTLQIQNLEARLGVRLFDRNQRRVRLTPAGLALVDEARRILGQIDDATRIVKRAQSGDTGRIRVGFLSSAMLTGIGERFAKVRKAMPGLTDTWIEMISSAQVDALQQGLIDIGFAHTPLDLGGVRSSLLLREPLVAVLHESHPAAKLSRISLDSLRDDSFIMFPRTASPRLHDMVVSTCYDAGFSPQIAHHANHFLTIVSLVSKGLGVALLPRWMRNLDIPGTVFKPIRGAKPLVQVSVLWHPKNPSPVLPAVLGLLGIKER